MTVMQLWIEQDIVIKILSIAFVSLSVLVIEKFIHYFALRSQLKRGLEEISLKPIRNIVDSVTAFDAASPLFRLHIESELERFELYATRFLQLIALIAILSPMLGLIGTFFGLWHVFAGVGSFGLNEPSVIARGIKEVLIDTMAGLIVAIYATVFYRLFNTLAIKLTLDFEKALYRYLEQRRAT